MSVQSCRRARGVSARTRGRGRGRLSISKAYTAIPTFQCAKSVQVHVNSTRHRDMTCMPVDVAHNLPQLSRTVPATSVPANNFGTVPATNSECVTHSTYFSKTCNGGMQRFLYVPRGRFFYMYVRQVRYYPPPLSS